KIKNHCKKFSVFHSDNDPYVSLENGQELSKKLNTKLIFIPNAGHFNKSAGYPKFDALFKKIIYNPVFCNSLGGFACRTCLNQRC
ncbi:alpha/beta hydrolase, partial [Candidatus Woesearchaeota archaeon]|nr:alpha/beta hydrolase [Candidatus Woesearchaeota archaeon]